MKSVIPWHVFQNAIDGVDSPSTSCWLERWHFMDAGVILSNSKPIPTLESLNNAHLRKKTDTDDLIDA
jgi:hypothetical protein